MVDLVKHRGGYQLSIVGGIASSHGLKAYQDARMCHNEIMVQLHDSLF